MGLQAAECQAASNPKRKLDALWINDPCSTELSGEFLQTSILGKLLSNCHQIGELGMCIYQCCGHGYPSVMQEKSNWCLDLMHQVLGLSPHTLRLLFEHDGDSGIPVFPPTVTLLLRGVRRVVFQGLAIEDVDLPYFEAHVAGQFPSSSEFVLEDCSFTDRLDTKTFVLSCVALMTHFRSVRINRSCKFSVSNAAAALTLVQTRQLMRAVEDFERAAFIDHMKSIITAGQML